MIYLIEYYSISMIYSILVISYIYIYHIYICHVCVYIYIQYVYCIILHTCMDSPRKNKKKLVQWVDRTWEKQCCHVISNNTGKS